MVKLFLLRLFLISFECNNLCVWNNKSYKRIQKTIMQLSNIITITIIIIIMEWKRMQPFKLCSLQGDWIKTYQRENVLILC